MPEISRHKNIKIIIMKKSLLVALMFFAINLQSQNKIESSLSENYSNGAWQITGGANYIYDANNNLASETGYTYNQSEWIALDKAAYTYNTANKAVIETHQSWNGTAFENNSKGNYTYNASGQPTTIIYQIWTTNTWQNDFKVEITYNSNLIDIGTNFNWINGQWLITSKTTATYTNNFLTQLVNEDWGLTQWNFSSRSIMTYNASNEITNRRDDLWTGTAWMENYNDSYVLAANGNRNIIISSRQGVLQYKMDYSYDGAALMFSFAHPFQDKTGLDYLTETFPYVNKVLRKLEYTYNENTASFNLSNRITYNYLNQLVLNTKSNDIKTIHLFPNPVANYFEISGLTSAPRVTIFNILGNKVFDNTVNVNEKINVENLTTGLYFLNFDNGAKIKFIKQ